MITWPISLDLVGKHPRKSFPSQTTSFFAFQDEVSFCHYSGTAVSSSSGTYLRLLCQSQAWLTCLHLISLFSEPVKIVHVTYEEITDCFIVSSPKLPLLQTPNQKYHQLPSLEGATGGARAGLSSDRSQMQKYQMQKEIKKEKLCSGMEI